MNRRRLLVIACQVFQRELESLADHAKTDVTIQTLEVGLHSGAAEKLRIGVQQAIDAVPNGKFDAIGLAYGLCNRGIVGLQSKSLPLVVPRAHDCIGMLLGSSERYLKELDAHPGTYFQTPGWVEHIPADRALREQTVPIGRGQTMSRQELVAKYGEENAEFLLEQLGNHAGSYTRLAYISTPVPMEQERHRRAIEIAELRGWTFAHLPGDLGWLGRLLDGEWNEREFLTLRPGQRLGLCYDERLIAAEP